MRTACPRLLAVALLVMLSACDSGMATDDIGTLFGQQSRAEKERQAELERRRENKVPIQSVGTVEIGRTADGILITAFGTAPGLGYALPALRVRRDGKPAADGYVEFDFVASEPFEGFDLPPGTSRTRALRADLPVKLRDLRGTRGLRIMAIEGAVQIEF